MSKLKGFLRDQLGVKKLNDDLTALSARQHASDANFKAKIAELDRLTAVDLDANFRGDCTIILTGTYKGRGYVQFYDVPLDEFRYFVDNMRQDRQTFRVKDVPYGFSGAFELKG